MTRPPVRAFVGTVLAGWLILSGIAEGYSRSRNIPQALAVSLTLALLTEYPFYVLPGFDGLLKYISLHLNRFQMAACIACSSLVPYLIYTLTSGSFQLPQAVCLAALMSGVAFWFLIPVGLQVTRPWIVALFDLGFLSFVATIILSGMLRWIIPSPAPKLPLEVLGHITLIRVAILASLLLRKADDAGFGFIPRAKDIAIGGGWAVACIAVTLPLASTLGRLSPVSKLPSLLPAMGVFLGILWVVALSEEFFFRGLLQVWITRWTGNSIPALFITSVIFGACHIGFGGVFPNWQFAILAAVLGLFCGVAFIQGRGMRASMVTHAAVASAFRLFVSWHIH